MKDLDMGLPGKVVNGYWEVAAAVDRELAIAFGFREISRDQMSGTDKRICFRPRRINGDRLISDAYHVP